MAKTCSCFKYEEIVKMIKRRTEVLVPYSAMVALLTRMSKPTNLMEVVLQHQLPPPNLAQSISYGISKGDFFWVGPHNLVAKAE